MALSKRAMRNTTPARRNSGKKLSDLNSNQKTAAIMANGGNNEKKVETPSNPAPAQGHAQSHIAETPKPTVGAFIENFDPRKITNARQRGYANGSTDTVKNVLTVVPDIELLTKVGNTIKIPIDHFKQFEDVKKAADGTPEHRSSVMKITSRLNAATSKDQPWAGRKYSVKHFEGDIYITRLEDGEPKNSAGRARQSTMEVGNVEVPQTEAQGQDVQSAAEGKEPAQETPKEESPKGVTIQRNKR